MKTKTNNLLRKAFTGLLFLFLSAAPLSPVSAEPETENAEQNENGDEVLLNNPVLAASADSPVTAEIFKDILAENGIAYSVDEKGDIMHTGFGGSYFATDIYVDEKDVDIAKELYRNLSENELAFDGFDDESYSEEN